jgi:5-methylcytosine-specific restriction endonuclease McrA
MGTELTDRLDTALGDLLALDPDELDDAELSRRRRFTGALRRAIEVRDRHCQHPSGCDEPAENCDVDHKLPYTDGGETSQENGELKCRPQNRDKAKRDKKPP